MDSENVSNTTSNKTQNLYEVIKKKFSTKPAADETLKDWEKSPDDKDLQASIRVQLKKIMLSDDNFSKEIVAIIQDGIDSGENNFNSTVLGNFQNSVQIGNSTISTQHDFIGHDKIEIHAEHFSWNEPTKVVADISWLKDGLNWLRNGFYSQYGSDRVSRYKVDDFSSWEKSAHELSNHSLYAEGRTLIDNRKYPKAVAYWAELWNREPNNSEYESYLRLCLSKVEREIRIDNAINALMGRAESAWHLGMYQSVVHDLEQVLALDPDNQYAQERIKAATEILKQKNDKQAAG